MYYREIFRSLSFFLFGLTIPLLIPLVVALYCEEIAPHNFPQSPCALSFFFTILITLALGILCRFIGRKDSGYFYRREALLLVLIVYVLISSISALPFYFSKTLPSFVDAFFEMSSGYTTTGATIMEPKNFDVLTGQETPIIKTYGSAEHLTTYAYLGTITPVMDPNLRVVLSGIEALSPALILWRSLTQFMGGGGIIILFLALLPTLGVGGKMLFQAEATGPSKETLAPRIKETASRLWKIYLSLTLLEIILLVATNQRMPLFDAISIAFSTISTGGFTPRNASIGAYHSGYTDIIIMIFMVLGSINFSLYFFCMKGKFHRLLDSECIVFFLIILSSSGFAAFYLKENYSLVEALRYGSFQMISTQTSTGFATANFDYWPYPVQSLMLILMFVGGMAGSTAGGLKIIRLQILFRVIVEKLESIFRPDSIKTLRLGLKTIDDKIASKTLCFFAIAALFLVSLTFFYMLEGIDPETAFSSASSMINNVGFAFRIGGPEHSFAFLSPLAKLFSALWMIAGRLEYFAFLVILLPSFWKSP